MHYKISKKYKSADTVGKGQSLSSSQFKGFNLGSVELTNLASQGATDLLATLEWPAFESW